MPVYIAVVLVLIFEAVCMATLVAAGLWLAAKTGRAGTFWVLSLATRRSMPLRGEIEDLAGSVTGQDRRRFSQLINNLYRGRSLGESLQASSGLVPAETAVLVQVAEDYSAPLGPIFAEEAARLARIREASMTVTNSLAMIMMYVVVIPVVLGLVFAGVFVFIVPKAQALFGSFGSAVPHFTTVVISFGDAVKQFWFVALAIPLLAIYAVMFWIFRDKFLKTPIGLLKVWPSSRRKRGSLALRAIELAVRNELPVESALATLAKKHPHDADRRSFQKLCARLGETHDVWAALRGQRLITRRDAELFRAAESAGNLPWALRYVIDRLDETLITRLTTFAELVQPAIVIAIGLPVAMVCVALFMPLAELLRVLD